MKPNVKIWVPFLALFFVLATIACTCSSLSLTPAEPTKTPEPTRPPLAGVGVRVIYTTARTADAEAAAARLGAQGATIDMSPTSDSGNEQFVGHIYYLEGYADEAALVASLVADLEPVVPMAGDPALEPPPGLQLFLWIVTPP